MRKPGVSVSQISTGRVTLVESLGILLKVYDIWNDIYLVLNLNDISPLCGAKTWI